MKSILVLLIILATTTAGNATPRGIRSNNPGNIMADDPTRDCKKWAGCVGVDKDGYLHFSKASQGLRAMRVILAVYGSKHKINTIEGICRRWVRKPKTASQEADLRQYIRAAAYRIGKPSAAVLEMTDRKMLARIAKGIIYAENSQQPYSEEVLKRAFEY